MGAPPEATRDGTFWWRHCGKRRGGGAAGVFVLLGAWEFRPDPRLPEVGVPGSAPGESAGAARAPAHHGDGGRPAALLPLRLLLLREPVRGALRAARALPGRAAAARRLRPHPAQQRLRHPQGLPAAVRRAGAGGGAAAAPRAGVGCQKSLHRQLLPPGPARALHAAAGCGSGPRVSGRSRVQRFAGCRPHGPPPAAGDSVGGEAGVPAAGVHGAVLPGAAGGAGALRGLGHAQGPAQHHEQLRGAAPRAGPGRAAGDAAAGALPAAADGPPVPRLRRRLAGQPPRLRGQVRPGPGPGAGLPLRQRRADHQRVPGQGLHRGRPVLWGPLPGAVGPGHAPGGGARGGPGGAASGRPAARRPAPGHRRAVEPHRLAAGLRRAQPPLPHVLPQARAGGRRGLWRRLHPRGARRRRGRVRDDLSPLGPVPGAARWQRALPPPPGLGRAE